MSIVRQETRPVFSIHDAAKNLKRKMKEELKVFDKWGKSKRSILWVAVQCSHKHLLR